MSLSAITKKLKQGRYEYASEVYQDLKLIIQNCKTFNMFQMAIIKKAELFEQCIKTQWNNFLKQIKKKDLSIANKIDVNDQILRRLISIEQKRKKKKTPSLQSTLQIQKKNILPEYTYLFPLPNYLFEDRNQIKQDLPEDMAYKKQDYINLKQEQKLQKFQLILNHQQIQKQFDIVSINKLNKYKKILYKKIMWIQQKIIKKCLQKKKYKKMLLPEYLSKFIQKGQIAQQLNIRKLQIYVKQVTYWIQQYSQILSHYMKEKFVDTCKSIRKCLLRVLRYKKIPKTTKITIQPGFDAPQNEENQDPLIQSKLQGEKQLTISGISEEEMLIRDRSQSTKRDTKITIKTQNGEFSIVDWNSQTNEKRKVNRIMSDGIKSIQRQFDQQKRKKQQRKDEYKKDQDFINDYRSRMNRDILQNTQITFQILWDKIQQRKYEQVNQEKNQNFQQLRFNQKNKNINQDYSFKLPLRV